MLRIFFNKALFYKEWLKNKWIAFLVMAEILIIWGMGFEQYVRNLKAFKVYGIKYVDVNLRFFSDSHSSFFLIFVSLVVLGCVTVGTDKNNNGYEVVTSMPFKKSEIIWTKWIFGAASLIVPMLISFALMSVIYIFNSKDIIWKVQYTDITEWFLITLLTYIFIMSFIMLFECLIGDMIVAGILGGGVLFSPTLIISSIYMIGLLINGKDINYMAKLTNNLMSKFMIIFYNQGYEACFNIRCLSLLILTAITLIFMILFFNKNIVKITRR